MNKKLIAVVVLVALATLFAVPAFADAASDAKAWFDDRFAAKKAYVDQAVKEGRITAEEGKSWKAHFDEMYKFHEQNGFTCPMGGPGAGKGMGPGRGPGGWGFNQAPGQTTAQQ